MNQALLASVRKDNIKWRDETGEVSQVVLQSVR